MNRFNVTLEREVIVYATDRKEAIDKALAYMKMPDEQPATRPIKVTAVAELPAIETEGRGPEIDRAPSRETRK